MEEKIKILLAEDEVNVAKFIRLELEYEGYEVTVAYDGREAWSLAQSETPDLFLLDWMLPELDGLEVCRRIRKKDQAVPIIILTARDYVGDKISGLDTGADDYITKPFEIEELLARIRAALRRTVNKHDEEGKHSFQITDLVLDTDSRLVSRAGKNIELTQREFDLLAYLMRNEGKVMDRDTLLSNVWGYDFAGETNVVDVYIRYLRNKIDKDYSPQLIHTIRGVGYVLRIEED